LQSWRGIDYGIFRLMKRAFDLVFASLGCLLLLPLLLLLAAAIMVGSPGPVFYRGKRIGLAGKPFRIFKFRTMIVDAEQKGGSSTSDSDSRITNVGRWMRKYKFDELPQLFNVILGEMSFVGPRPEVEYYVNMYTQDEKAILTVRPGITDWASIWNSDEGAVLAASPDPDKAYLELIRPEKIRLQLKYVHSRSFATDLRILLETAKVLLHRDRLSAVAASKN
jgi:lipopolysaccharide/colanic/teichoic acid biosynthesis glycosyltransferase